jgi:hypothetical protein
VVIFIGLTKRIKILTVIDLMTNNFVHVLILKSKHYKRPREYNHTSSNLNIERQVCIVRMKIITIIILIIFLINILYKYNLIKINAFAYINKK